MWGSFWINALYKEWREGQLTLIQLSVLWEPSSTEPVTCFLCLNFWKIQEREMHESNGHTPALYLNQGETGEHCTSYYKAKLFSGKSAKVGLPEMGVKWAGITKVLRCLLRLSSTSIHKYLDNNKTTEHKGWVSGREKCLIYIPGNQGATEKEEILPYDPFFFFFF